MSIANLNRSLVVLDQDGIHGESFLSTNIGKEQTFGDIFTKIEMKDIISGWVSKNNIWPIRAYCGTIDDINYKNRYLSKPFIFEGKMIDGVFINQAYVGKKMEEHLAILLIWTMIIKQLRRCIADQMKHTFYHHDSSGRSKLEDFAATCFTTLAVGEFSKLGQKHVIAKQVHDYNNLSPQLKDRLLHIYLELRHLFTLQEYGLLTHYNTQKEGVLWLINHANEKLQKLGLLDLNFSNENKELVWLMSAHPFTHPVADLGDENDIYTNINQ